MPTLASNKKAYHDYTILETYEAGIVLTGPEVKSVRSGALSLKGAHVLPREHNNRFELLLLNAHISPYAFANPKHRPDTDRTRHLLLHHKEIASLIGKTQQKGLTIVCLSMYTKGNRIKVSLGLTQGKKLFDKRETIKKKENDRSLRRALRKKY